MKKEVYKISTIFVLVLLLFGAGIVPLIGGITVEKQDSTDSKTSFMVFNHRGDTLYVGGSGPGNYSKIQEAINDANNGDTIFVYDDSSPYFECVNVDVSINLIGENKETTIIDGSNNAGPIIDIDADGVVVSCFTLQNSGLCIDIYYQKSCIISENIIDTHRGIYIYDGNNFAISNNIFKNNEENAITFFGLSDSIAFGNTIINDKMEDAINVINSYNITISYNSITSIKAGIYGIQISNTKYCNILWNTVSNTICGINVAMSYGPDIDYTTNIQWNNITDNFIGISLEGCSYTTVTQNNFIGNIMHGFFTIRGGEIQSPLQIIKVVINGIKSDLTDHNNWNHNYWDTLFKFGPKPIRGRLNYRMGISHSHKECFLPWRNFDWNPVQEPYHIPGDLRIRDK